VSNPDVFPVSVLIPDGTEIYCRGNMAATVSMIQDGDRIELGTRFVAQGVRSANWIVVNGLAGWSEIAAVSPSEVTLTQSSVSGYGWTGANVTVAAIPTTRVVTSDGSVQWGSFDGLDVGYQTTWTAVANEPSYSPATIWGVAVNTLQSSGW
jgi:hypothetical protein